MVKKKQRGFEGEGDPWRSPSRPLAALPQQNLLGSTHGEGGGGASIPTQQWRM